MNQHFPHWGRCDCCKKMKDLNDCLYCRDCIEENVQGNKRQVELLRKETVKHKRVKRVLTSSCTNPSDCDC